MDDKPIFISKSQRECLLKAYDLIEQIKLNVSNDCEEYSAIKTTLYYLKNAIKYKEKYY